MAAARRLTVPSFAAAGAPGPSPDPGAGLRAALAEAFEPFVAEVDGVFRAARPRLVAVVVDGAYRDEARRVAAGVCADRDALLVDDFARPRAVRDVTADPDYQWPPESATRRLRVPPGGAVLFLEGRDIGQAAFAMYHSPHVVPVVVVTPLLPADVHERWRPPPREKTSAVRSDGAIVDAIAGRSVDHVVAEDGGTLRPPRWTLRNVPDSCEAGEIVAVTHDTFATVERGSGIPRYRITKALTPFRVDAQDAVARPRAVLTGLNRVEQRGAGLGIEFPGYALVAAEDESSALLSGRSVPLLIMRSPGGWAPAPDPRPECAVCGEPRRPAGCGDECCDPRLCFAPRRPGVRGSDWSAGVCMGCFVLIAHLAKRAQSRDWTRSEDLVLFGLYTDMPPAAPRTLLNTNLNRHIVTDSAVLAARVVRRDGRARGAGQWARSTLRWVCAVLTGADPLVVRTDCEEGDLLF